MCGECGGRHGCHHGGGGYGGDCGYPAVGYGRRAFSGGRIDPEDELEDLEGYRANLEAELRRLERRIGTLRPK